MRDSDFRSCLKHAITALKSYLKGKYLFEASGCEYAMSAWIIHTHFFDIFPFSPPLFVAAGKRALSSVSEDLRCLCRNGKNLFLRSSFIDPELFGKPPATLVIENLDGLAMKGPKRSSELIRFILRSSQKELFSSNFDRTQGKSVAKEAFFPKAVLVPLEASSMQGLKTLKDSSLFIKITGPRHQAFYADLRIVCTAIKEVLDKHLCSLRPELAKEVPKFYGNLWKEKNDAYAPLFSLAQVCGCEFEKELKKAAFRLIELEEDNRKILFEAYELMKKRGLNEIGSVELAKSLYSRGFLQASGSQNEALLARKLSRILRAFSICSVPLKRSGKMFRGYRKEDIEKAIERLGGQEL